MNTKNPMMIPASTPHPPLTITPPQNHPTPSQNHLPPPENHHLQSTFSPQNHHPNHITQPQLQLPLADLAFFLAQNAQKQQKLVEEQANYQQKLAHLLHSLVYPSLNTQLHHSSVPAGAVVSTADSAVLRQEKSTFPVQVLPTGSDLLQVIPQVSNSILRPPTTVPALVASSINFSIPETTSLGNFSCNNPVSVQVLANNDVSQFHYPQHSSLTLHNQISSSSVVTAENAEKTHENHLSSVNIDNLGQTTFPPLTQHINTHTRPSQIVSLVTDAHSNFSPVETNIFRQKTPLLGASLVNTHVQTQPHSSLASYTPIIGVSVGENSLSQSFVENDKFPTFFPQNEQQNAHHFSGFTQHFNTDGRVENGGNVFQNHPEYCPTVTTPQYTVLSSGFTALHPLQNSQNASMSALCTDSVTVQTADCAVAFSAQGSRPVLTCSNTQPLTSHSPTQPFVSLTPATPQLSSSLPTETNFASLFKNSASIPKPPIPLAPIPTPYTKGSLPAIKLDEIVYQKSLQACQLNLIGRLSSPKGTSPFKLSELHTKLNSFWKCREAIKLTPIGSGYFCLRFKSKEDQDKAWSHGPLNLSPGSFRLQPWVRDFHPSLQKRSVTNVWIRLHQVTQEYWDPQLLITIASLVGIPQAIDPSTMAFLFGHYARIQVEVDLHNSLPPRLLVEREGYSFEVPVTYENVPAFCTHCGNIGHLVGECRTLKKMQGSVAIPGNMKGIKTFSTKPSNTIPQPPNKSVKQKHQATNGASGTVSLVVDKVVKSHTPPTQVQLITSSSETDVNIDLHDSANIIEAQSSEHTQSHNKSVYTATSSKSKETVVPCTSNSGSKGSSPSTHKIPSLSKSGQISPHLPDDNWDGRPLPQFRNQSLPSLGKDFAASHSHHFTRARHNNKFSPLSDHLFDDDGETWGHFSDDSMEKDNECNDSIGYYSPAGSNQFIAIHKLPKLNVNESLNWATMADDPPFQSREALADEQFAEALTKNKVDSSGHCTRLQQVENQCIQLEMDDRSSILEQDFPPLQKNLTPTGTTYVPSPIMTRAQRQKKSTALSVTKQQKLKKATIRESKALSRLSKSKTLTHSLPLDPDEVQWHICLKDIKQRMKDAKKAETTASTAVL